MQCRAGAAERVASMSALVLKAMAWVVKEAVREAVREAAGLVADWAVRMKQTDQKEQ